MLTPYEVAVSDIQHYGERHHAEPFTAAQWHYPGKPERRNYSKLYLWGKRARQSCRQPGHIHVTTAAVSGQPVAGVTRGYAELEAQQRWRGNDIKNVPAFACADPADASSLLNISWARRAVVTCRAADFMRPQTAKPRRFNDRSAERRDTRPEGDFGRGGIFTCADSAYALSLPDASRARCAVMAHRTADAMRVVFAKPCRFENHSAKLGDAYPEGPIGSDGIVARANPADTKSALDIARARRAFMAFRTANPVPLADSKPYRLYHRSVQLRDALSEGGFGGRLAYIVILADSRGPFSVRDPVRVLVTPPGPATSIVAPVFSRMEVVSHGLV